jgi:hypothetical protein
MNANDICLVHKGSLYLTHNQHKSYYETVAEAIKSGTHGYQDDYWVSLEQRHEALETNDCWTLVSGHTLSLISRRRGF